MSAPVAGDRDARATQGEPAWLHGEPVDSYQAAVDIDADAATVYQAVADVTSTGSYSPECRRVQWLPGYSQASVGARFRGKNRWRGYVWSRDAVITATEPGSRFSFETIPARGINNSRTVWTYHLTSLNPHQTRVEQRFDWYAPRWIHYFDVVLGRPSSLRRNVKTSLQNLKVITEQASVSN